MRRWRSAGRTRPDFGPPDDNGDDGDDDASRLAPHAVREAPQ